jgi:hypothetical protein
MSARGSRSRIGLRLRVRLRRGRLDRELADGLLHDTTAERALRAQQLVGPRSRRALARSLNEVIAMAANPRANLISSAVPIVRDAVSPFREALLGVAERLDDEAPCNPCGVARLQSLLTDGAGPLYNGASERSLGDLVWWVADGLQLCPPHDWGCPLVLEFDPARVGWTCARCGAIATTGDVAVRPA